MVSQHITSATRFARILLDITCHRENEFVFTSARTAFITAEYAFMYGESGLFFGEAKFNFGETNSMKLFLSNQNEIVTSQKKA